jgi:hypothetical protein
MTAADMAEGAAGAEGAAASEGAAVATAVLAKCTRQCALTAARNAKFRSSRLKEGLFTAGTASPSTRSSRFDLGLRLTDFVFFSFTFQPLAEAKPIAFYSVFAK